MQEHEFLTPEEVAKLLRISLRSVQRHIKTGVIPAVRIGAKWRIPKELLLKKLIEERPKEKPKQKPKPKPQEKTEEKGESP